MRKSFFVATLLVLASVGTALAILPEAAARIGLCSTSSYSDGKGLERSSESCTLLVDGNTVCYGYSHTREYDDHNGDPSGGEPTEKESTACKTGVTD